MIKLNNKNITYVALADTNNSIKAPKEIWYADSSNSVKLVYRRKDALIEGEDYEKYHWLVGDESSYIDVPRSNEVTDVIHFKVDTSNSGLEGVRGIFGNIRFGAGVNNNNIIHFVKYNSNYMACRAFNSDNELRPTRYSIMSVDILTDSVKVNSDTYELNRGTTALEGYSMPIFSRRRINADLTTNITKEIIAASLAYFKIDNVLDLIPCKLLKPVPKWLDANGIRRQVGECGMIDLVSGKFYGNVNSVGTFTVENYYERKEWLCGRNGAYIDTMHQLVSIDDAMRVHAHYDGVTKNPSGDEQAICGVVEDLTDANKLWAYIYIGTDNTLNAYQRGVYRYSLYGLQTDTVNSLEFIASISNDGNNFTFTKNSNSITKSNPITRKTYGNVYLFNRNTMAQPELVSQRYFQGDIASFQIGNSTFTELSVDMIPCTLTMDLPASMDANNIARTKGTSGMWDLVSDKFYGNVANNGTFKAVNLAEGVDYEVHQWLKGDGEAYITIPINVYQETLTAVVYPTDREGSTGYIWYSKMVNDREIRAYVTEKNAFTIRHGLRLDGVPPQLIYTYTLNQEYNVSISRNADGVVSFINNGVETLVNVAFDNRLDTVIDLKLFSKDCKVKKLQTDNYSLIPVKLLKSIPSKYDANGIARQAGECGMYDTVNDVFYGNVASSGSFTVEDDN